MKKWFVRSASAFATVVFVLSGGVAANAAEVTDEFRVPVTSYSAAGICAFTQHGDRAHISSSGGPRAVQAHGWWQKGNCKATIATVTVQLQKKIGTRWVDVGRQGSGEFGAGGGRGKRATARYECKGTARTTYRSWVDVNVHGILDTPGAYWSAEVTLNCG